MNLNMCLKKKMIKLSLIVLRFVIKLVKMPRTTRGELYYMEE